MTNAIELFVQPLCRFAVQHRIRVGCRCICNRSESLLPVLDERRDSRQRDDRTRQHILAEQGVQERALAPLDLPEDREVEPPLREALLQVRRDVVRGRRNGNP